MVAQVHQLDHDDGHLQQTGYMRPNVAGEYFLGEHTPQGDVQEEHQLDVDVDHDEQRVDGEAGGDVLDEVRHVPVFVHQIVDSLQQVAVGRSIGAQLLQLLVDLVIGLSADRAEHGHDVDDDDRTEVGEIVRIV